MRTGVYKSPSAKNNHFNKILLTLVREMTVDNVCDDFNKKLTVAQDSQELTGKIEILDFKMIFEPKHLKKLCSTLVKPFIWCRQLFHSNDLSNQTQLLIIMGVMSNITMT